MTVQHVGAGAPSALQPLAAKLSLPGGVEFGDSLRLGEIIKGRVLRQYDGGRYLVSFDGQERVVDSSIPLQTGELIHGRVITIGERVELQRVPAPDVQSEIDSVPQISLDARLRGRAGQLLDQVLSRYNLRLNAEEAGTLTNAIRRADDGQAMALAGAMLSKLGLKQAPELLWPLYSALVRRETQSTGLVLEPVVDVARVAEQGAQTQPALIRQIAEAIDRTIDKPDDEGRDPDASPTPGAAAVPGVIGAAVPAIKQLADDDPRSGRDALARWLLNAQIDGSVAHRLGTLPLLLGDRLVEVEMSFFEQRRDAEQRPDARHRKIVFALQLEGLGRVEVTAHLAGNHVGVKVATQDGDKTAVVSRHAEQLRSLLDGIGWTVDEVVYETRRADEHNGVVRAVVEHVVSQDSLNRLV